MRAEDAGRDCHHFCCPSQFLPGLPVQSQEELVHCGLEESEWGAPTPCCSANVEEKVRNLLIADGAQKLRPPVPPLELCI